MKPVRSRRLSVLIAALLATAVGPVRCPAQTQHAYKYFRLGNSEDAVHATPRAGYALMGGGTDLDEAFQWLCERAGRGDLVVLRATGSDDYNPYIRKLCPSLNSVASLVLPDRAAAEDAFVATTIRKAEAVFISGGDQGNYVNFWKDTPVQDAINEDIDHGIPLGGTSAGLAVMGEWGYSAQADKPDDPNLSGKLAMADPYGARLALNGHFISIPMLKGVITDTHFAKRDRMGRLLVFLARLNEPDGKPVPPPGLSIRGIGVEERAALLLEPDGTARVVGHGSAYFIDAQQAHGTLARGKPLTFGPYAVQRVAPGRTFNLRTWSGISTAYRLNVKNGNIVSTQAGGKIY